MRCPVCASDSVIRAATFYEQATGSVNLRTSGVGIGVGGGAVGVGVGAATTSGRTQSLAAQRLRPPYPTVRSSFHVFVILASIAAAVVVVGTIANTLPRGPDGKVSFLMATLGLVVALGIFAAGVVQALRMWSADQIKCEAKDSEALHRWRRLWYCTRCGHTADVDAFASAGGQSGTALS